MSREKGLSMLFALLPTRAQWKRWSLPSKYTLIGLLIALIGLLGTLLGLPQQISWYLGLGDSTQPNGTTTMIQEGVKNVQISGGSGGINIGRDLNIHIEGKQRDVVGEYLQQVKNYKEVGDVEKALEASKEALKINPNSIDAIYFTAYAYLAKKDEESIYAARDLLNSKFKLLTAREKVLLGFAEYKLNNNPRSYKILSSIDLIDLDNETLPHVVGALVQTAFNTFPYDEAVYHIQAPLKFIQRKVAYVQPSISKVGRDKMELSINRNYWRILSSQLNIGDTWLARAYNTRNLGDWIKAMGVATNGFQVCCDTVNKKDDILRYLSLFNEILKKYAFLTRNTNKILRFITYYIEVLSGMNTPSYQIEIEKLKILYNIIIDTTELNEDKFDIYTTEKINFHLGISELEDDVAIRSVILKKNFMISKDRNLLSDMSPRRVIPAQIIPLTIEKGSRFSKDAIFVFNVVVEDTSFNTANGLLIPSLFPTRFEELN